MSGHWLVFAAQEVVVNIRKSVSFSGKKCSLSLYHTHTVRLLDKAKLLPVKEGVLLNIFLWKTLYFL